MTLNIFAPIALVYLILLAVGVIPFTALAVVIGIVLAQVQINMTVR